MVVILCICCGASASLPCHDTRWQLTCPSESLLVDMSCLTCRWCWNVIGVHSAVQHPGILPIYCTGSFTLCAMYCFGSFCCRVIAHQPDIGRQLFCSSNHGCHGTFLGECNTLSCHTVVGHHAARTMPSIRNLACSWFVRLAQLRSYTGSS